MWCMYMLVYNNNNTHVVHTSALTLSWTINKFHPAKECRVLSKILYLSFENELTSKYQLVGINIVEVRDAFKFQIEQKTIYI